jgi:hypothetical protein
VATVKNLVGLRFGRLVVRRFAGVHMCGGHALWECLCDCGKTAIVQGRSLKSGNTRSCGCLSSRFTQKRKSLVGERFGRLVVEKFVGASNGYNALWECVCDCRNRTVVQAGNLTSGNTRSCGCLHNEMLIKNLAGQRFGRLIVRRLLRRHAGKALWECECDCGGTAVVSGASLISGHTKSCGCLNVERARVLGERSRDRIIHGHARSGGRTTRTYRSWTHMWQRCGNPNNKRYAS